MTGNEAMRRAAEHFAAGHLDQARATAEAIVAADPRNFHALHLLAVLAARRGDYSACVDLSTRALQLEPRNAEVLSNRGAALRRMDRIDEALADYDRALSVAPNWMEAWNNRGVALAALNRHAEAVESYDRALALKPDDAMARFNRALSRLVTGDLARGWQDHESRWGGSDTQEPRRDFGRPQWTGGPLDGKTLLVHAEQGLGDAIQFVRYAPLVAARGAQVVVEAQTPLAGLLREFLPQARVVPRGEQLPAFDLHCPMLSLPLACGTTLENIPAHVPYLGANADRVEMWRERLGPTRGPRIGLAWSGSPSLANDRNRSIALERLAPLLALDFDFVSLQKDVRERDVAALEAHGNLRHFGAAMADFRDTAALISLVDLVVSVDTAAAHLAGAMARPVWILLPFAPDWRWLLGREDSPWYPTARLWRQRTRGDWGEVIEGVRSEAARFALRGTRGVQ